MNNYTLTWRSTKHCKLWTSVNMTTFYAVPNKTLQMIAEVNNTRFRAYGEKECQELTRIRTVGRKKFWSLKWTIGCILWLHYNCSLKINRHHHQSICHQQALIDTIRTRTARRAKTTVRILLPPGTIQAHLPPREQGISFVLSSHHKATLRNLAFWV